MILTAQEKELVSLNVKMNERTIKMDELITENKGNFKKTFPIPCI